MSVWKYVCVRCLEKQMNVTVPLAVWYMEDGETKKVLRRVQMYIDEDPVHHLLNKFKIILIRILSVTLVFLYFYFGNSDPQFSTL